jgi:hypothetical protein
MLCMPIWVERYRQMVSGRRRMQVIMQTEEQEA